MNPSVTELNPMVIAGLPEIPMDIFKAAMCACRICNGASVYKRDRDKEFWADESSEEGLPDVEISESDKWKCGKCGSLNKPLMRFCTKCWDQRVGWLPDRHERRQKPRRRARSTKHSSQTSKINSINSVPTVFANLDCNHHNSSSAERCDSGISSQKFLDLPSSQISSEPGTSRNTVSLQSSVTSQPSSQEQLCSLCLTKPKNATIIHGKVGHQLSCYRCARKLQSMKKPCPICRLTIDRVVHQIVI